jgi:hypothetical protein
MEAASISGGRDMLKSSAIAIAVVLAAGTAGSAVAQEIPNMVGTWKGSTKAVIIGSNPYRVAETNGPSLPPNPIEFTYAITKQEDNRFVGTSGAGKFVETLIGAVNPEGKTGIMIDNDGQYQFTLRDTDTMDVCYWHSNLTSKVVACWQLKRTK